jgi:hypothetical protein
MAEFITDKLLNKNPFDRELEECNSLFFTALVEELCFHYSNNEKYRKFCKNKGFDPRGYKGVLSEIPSVTVSVFKELGTELSSVDTDEIKIKLQSSATSGVPSTILLDKVTAKRQAKAMIKVVQEFIGKERKPFLVMDVNPSLGNQHLIGARYAAISGYLKFANEVDYFLNVRDNNYSFDINSISKHISKLNPDKPVVVFGFTHMLFSEVIKPNLNINLQALPKGSKVIHIGGWKKLENEKVSKDIFNDLTAKKFGISQEDIVDIYGFTEQMGLNYPDCKCGFKHTSIYSKVIVRDPVSKEVILDNKTGLLEFLTPIPHSYPGNVVLTDDLGFIDSSECPYGLSGIRFKVVGRLKKAEIRGCGDVLTSKLKFHNVKVNPQNETNNSLRIDFWVGKAINVREPEKKLNIIINQLNRQKEWLRNQNIDALIGLISKVSSSWVSNNDLESLHNKGLSFLSQWCKQEHLVRLSTLGLRGNRLHMESFLPVLNSNMQYLKANQRGLACHWLAGNVQILGFFALIQSILTKNVNLLKVSSRDDGVFSELLNTFKNVTYTTKGGITINGNDLLKTIAVIYFNHSNILLGEIMSKQSDIRIAWGGKEAVETVSNLPSRFDCEDIIFGPKLSFSVIDRESLDNERKAKKIARKAAVDISIFDQTGCASPHNLYIETGGKIQVDEFAALLAKSLDKTSLQIPKGLESNEQIASIHSIRGVYEFKGSVWASDDSTWTILLSDDNKLNPPIYSRVIYIHPIQDIKETLPFIDENIQTIGISASDSRAIKYIEMASDLGVMRFPEIGKMLNFESPWDGIFIMERMVRWTTFGGPIV